jgi:cell division protein FtsW
VGATLVLLLFGILIWKGIQVAINAPDTFSSLTAAGIVLLISSQVLINIAVVTNSIPNTGVPLPLISYGGTALIIMMAMIGVLLNISRCTKKRD